MQLLRARKRLVPRNICAFFLWQTLLKNSLRKSLLQRGNSAEEIAGILALNSEELVVYNPKLADFTPTTRMAYARFRNVVKRDLHPHLEEDEELVLYLVFLQ